MSKTADLDRTIELLNGMLSSAESVKEKLQITDRLLRAHGLKYKHDSEGKGAKFGALEKGTDNGN
jgi:hypothetical protein